MLRLPSSSIKWFSKFLGNHPRYTLLSTLLSVLPLLSYFLIFPIEIECDLRRGFAKPDGNAMKELKNFAEFYNMDYRGLEIWMVIISAKESQTFLKMSKELLDEISRLEKWILNLEVQDGDATYRFNDTSNARINYAFDYFSTVYTLSEWLPSVNLTHPVAEAFGTEFFTGSHFFVVNNRSNEMKPVDTAQFITLWFMNEAKTLSERKSLRAIQLEVFKQASSNNFSSMFKVEMYGDEVANAEMLRSSMETVRLLCIGVSIMIVFMFTCFRGLTFKSQIALVSGALLAPCLATGTALSILGWMGLGFNTITCITPFLIVGIGVDDAFLLRQSWALHSSADVKSTRLQAVLIDIGPSLAITSLTNSLAFLIGFFFSSPQLAIFCLCTSLAMLLDFAFEILFFVPILVIFYEEKSTDTKNPTYLKQGSFWHIFTSHILSVKGKLFVFLLFVTTITISFVGIQQIEVTFDPSKTFPSDSLLQNTLEEYEIIQQEYAPLNFITRSPPDIQNEDQAERFLKMIERLESRDDCYQRHNIFLEYLQHLRENNITYSYSHLDEFVRNRVIADSKMLQYRFDPTYNQTILSAFNFIIICRGDLNWNRRAFSVEKLRSILSEYPEFKTSLFDYDATIFDLIITIEHELAKAVTITLACMGLVCICMIPSLLGAIISVSAMFLISFSLFGFLSISNNDLDPITTVNLLISFGFSVDFSVHACFHYHKIVSQGKLTDGHEIIAKVLESVGRPLIEASLSTFLCVVPLFFVPVYIITSFAKTVTAVNSFGLLYGVIFIPSVLHFIHNEKSKNNNKHQPLLPQK